MKVAKKLTEAATSAQQVQKKQKEQVKNAEPREKSALIPRGVDLGARFWKNHIPDIKSDLAQSRMLFIEQRKERWKLVSQEYLTSLATNQHGRFFQLQNTSIDTLRKFAQSHFLRYMQQETSESLRTRQIAALVSRGLPDTGLVARLSQGSDKVSVAKVCYALATHLAMLDCILIHYSSLADAPSFFASEIGALLAVSPQGVRPVGDHWLQMSCAHTAIYGENNCSLATEFLKRIHSDGPLVLPCGCDVPRILLEAIENFFILSRKNVISGSVHPDSLENLQNEIVRVIGMFDGLDRVAYITFMMSGFDAEPDRFTSHVMLQTGARLLQFLNGSAKSCFEALLMQLLIRKGDIDALESLIKQNGDITLLRSDMPLGFTRQVSGPLADTPLHMVARNDGPAATEQAALLLKAGAPMRALRTHCLCNEGVSPYLEEPIMLAAQAGNVKLVQALRVALDDPSVSETDKQISWPQRLARLDQAFSEAKKNTDKDYISKAWIELVAALSDVVLVDASLAHDRRIIDGISMLISLQMNYLADYFYWHQNSWMTMHTDADYLRFVGPVLPDKLTYERTKQEHRTGAIKDLTLVTESLSFLADDTQRALVRDKANVSAPIDTWIDAVIEAQKTINAPRAIKLYNRHGAKPTHLLVMHGPSLSIEEHSLLIATLLLRGAGSKEPNRDSVVLADRSLLQYLTTDERLAKRPEVVEKVIFAALACDALPWAKALVSRLKQANTEIFGKDNACEKACVLKAITCGAKEFSFILELVRDDTLQTLCSSSDANGDSLLHVLAQDHAGLITAVTARLSGLDLEAALALQNIAGQTLFGELVACARTDVIAKLLRQHPTIQVSIPEPLPALMRRPSRSLNSILSRQGELPKLFAAVEPHLPALAIELARTGDGDALLLLASRTPSAICAAKLNEPSVLHLLADSGLRKTIVKIFALLDDKAISALLAHRDADGRYAHDLGEIPPAPGVPSHAQTNLKKTKNRSTAQKEAAALKRATVAVIVATSHKMCTDAVTNFITEVGLQLSRSTPPAPEQKQATSKAAWTVLATLNRWDELALGAHFSAHRPEVSLVALKKRGVQLGLSASSRFHQDDGFAILQARAIAIAAAHKAKTTGLLRWKRFEHVEQMYDVEGGEGYLRRPHEDEWAYVKNATQIKFIFGLRGTEPFIVSAYPVLDYR